MGCCPVCRLQGSGFGISGEMDMAGGGGGARARHSAVVEGARTAPVLVFLLLRAWD